MYTYCLYRQLVHEGGTRSPGTDNVKPPIGNRSLASIHFHCMNMFLSFLLSFVLSFFWGGGTTFVDGFLKGNQQEKAILAGSLKRKRHPPYDFFGTWTGDPSSHVGRSPMDPSNGCWETIYMFAYCGLVVEIPN